MSDNINILTAEAVELLKEMIAIPSPSFHEEDVCSHISNWLTQKGVEHERIGNNIIAEHIVNPEEPTLMLCAHIDTVDPCEGYSFDPYKPKNSPEGVIQGLGSNDDGASVVSMIAAYRYWRLGNFQNNPSHAIGAGPSPCGQGGSTVFKTTPTDTEDNKKSSASSRINVTDNSALGLPRAEVRMACSKGTYVRAFARDLGEALGSGAHLDSLQRSRSGIFRVENALTVDQAIECLKQ